mmetsp:Transcript_73596/g.168718  ORF Transcript_73596/g.168718 Transcript_73596/m.168718 type:complete len:80 (+) Transcript_73596:304-543(+)
MRWRWIGMGSSVASGAVFSAFGRPEAKNIAPEAHLASSGGSHSPRFRGRPVCDSLCQCEKAICSGGRECWIMRMRAQYI